MTEYKIEIPEGTQLAVITRHVHAPRDIVFRTLTDPLKVPDFWGPERLTTVVQKMTVMPGGSWRYVQTDKEGNKYGFHGVYHDVVIPERLVYTSEFDGIPGHVALYTETFTEQDSETVITSHVIFQSVEDRDQVLQWGMEEGVSEMTRRLNALLNRENVQKVMKPAMDLYEENSECITITRTFDAPVKAVWERWTDPNQYMCWWGPKDFTSPYARFDLRPGGKFLSCMRGPDGTEYWDTGRFEEIDELNRIVYTDSWADAEGNIVPPSYYGMPGDQPFEMAVQVNLEDVAGKTRLTLEHCGFPDGEMTDQAKSGWNQSLDKLAECLR
ncbi:MAG TPA: SRPBCC domain-containing protein [Anaerolineales bacterium]|nr:SRPBCC domain-containing protein [Anaerolineales bacterium]